MSCVAHMTPIWPYPPRSRHYTRAKPQATGAPAGHQSDLESTWPHKPDYITRRPLSLIGLKTPGRSSTCSSVPSGPPLLTQVATSSDENLSGLRESTNRRLGSVIVQKPLPKLRSSPTRMIRIVASSSTQEDRLPLYDHENNFQKATILFAVSDASQTSRIQVSSSVDAVRLSGRLHPDQFAASIKKKRQPVVSIPMLAFGASSDSLFKATTTLEDPIASSAPTASESQDESLLDVNAIIALAGTLCDSTPSSTSRSPAVDRASTPQGYTTSPPFQAHENLPVEVAGNSEVAFVSYEIRDSPQKCTPFEDVLEPITGPEVALPFFSQPSKSASFTHVPQYHEEESALAYLQHSGRHSPRSTRLPVSLETIQEEEPAFYDDILATPSPPYHHESAFSDNTQSSQGLTPKTLAAGWKKKRFSLVEALPRSTAVVTQKQKRRSAPSTLGLGWFKTTSSPLRRAPEQSSDVKPVEVVSSLRPLILPMQVAMRGRNTPLKQKHSSTVSMPSPKRRSWIKNLISQHSSPWPVSPPILNVIPATPPLNNNLNGTINDPTVSNCASLPINPKFLYPPDSSFVVETDDSYTDAFLPVIIEPTPIKSNEGAIAERRRSQSLDELIALIDSYDFEAGRVKGHSSLIDLSSSEAQLDWSTTSSSSSSSSSNYDGSCFDESEDSMFIGVAL